MCECTTEGCRLPRSACKATPDGRCANALLKAAIRVTLFAQLLSRLLGVVLAACRLSLRWLNLLALLTSTPLPFSCSLDAASVLIRRLVKTVGDVRKNGPKIQKHRHEDEKC